MPAKAGTQNPVRQMAEPEPPRIGDGAGYRIIRAFADDDDREVGARAFALPPAPAQC
jgi:hypothetical protein